MGNHEGVFLMKTILMDVDTEKFVLSTIDGQEYYVEPGDITICCSWTPTAELEILTQNGQKFCKNLSNGQVVRFI